MDAVIDQSLTDRAIAPSAASSGVRFELATRADDGDIRRLLRENPMPGQIQLSLEREPDSFIAAAIEGDVHHTILARDGESGRAIGIGGVSVRDAYLNGKVARIGYLGQLRLDRSCKSRGAVIRRGYAFLRGLCASLGAAAYFTTIADDNARTRRLLERGVRGMPTYRRIDSLVTSLFPPQVALGRRFESDVDVTEARPEQIDEVIECLARNRSNYSLAPVWREVDVAHCLARSQRPEADPPELELIVAARGGHVVGCIAAWDQSAFKQTIVRGYSPLLARTRRFVNAGHHLFGTTYLPPVGAALNLIYLSHLAVDDNDPDVFRALLRYACSPRDAWVGEENRSYFALALPARHPLQPETGRGFRRRTYRTNLYSVEWTGMNASALLPDDAICQPEVALL